MTKTLLYFFSIKGRINRKKFNIPFLSSLAISQLFSGYLYAYTSDFNVGYLFMSMKFLKSKLYSSQASL